jgi:hypothetical protein
MQTVNIRGVPEWAVLEFRTNAGARSLKNSEYLTALIVLHRQAKEAARENEQFGAMLDSLGLTEIVV